MTDKKAEQAAELARAKAELTRMAGVYLDVFTSDAGRVVLEHLKAQAFRCRRVPRDGMTMQETGVFTLGEQSLYHMIEQNIENATKARQHGLARSPEGK